MARKRRIGRSRRNGLTLSGLDSLTGEELAELAVHALSETTVATGHPWRPGPLFGVTAHRILIERERAR